VPCELHAIARNRALGQAACGTDVAAPVSFGLRATAIAGREWLEATSAPYAVLLTNASRASKRWPDDRWRALARELRARGLRALLFAGSAAEERDTRQRAAGMDDAWVAPRCGIDTVAAVLARARLVVGLDTGLSHLAAALGAPTVGIFCDYDPRLVGITGTAPCASLGGVNASPTVEAVAAAVDGLLGCGAAAPRLP
jgi:heptosyltransferase-1